MHVLHILLDGQEEPQHTPLAMVDTDKWHRTMSPCLPRALKQSEEEIITVVNDIERSVPKHPGK